MKSFFLCVCLSGFITLGPKNKKSQEEKWTGWNIQDSEIYGVK